LLNLCVISFTILPYTLIAFGQVRPVNYPGTRHAIRPQIHKKILPPEKKAGNFFRSRSGDLEGRLRLAASCSRAPRHLSQHGAGLLAGAGVEVVVAEENLRGRCAGVAVRLTLGGLDDQIDAAIVGQRLIQLEGEGVTLAHDGGAGGVLDAQEGRRDNHRLAAAGDNPVVQAGEQVGSGDLGAGAQDAAALHRRHVLP